MAYKTPGVFVEEIATFPPSVVAVETAVPAFIGYTEKAEDSDGSSLLGIPKRIKSLLDFETYFGGSFEPNTYNVVLNTSNGNVGVVTPLDGNGNERHYYLYKSIRHYFANGGGPCYIVSVGFYPTQPDAGNSTTGLRGGLTPIRSMDEPTLLLFPDGAGLSEVELGLIQVDALNQCADLMDRFTIMDLVSGNAPPAIGVDPAAEFRTRVGTANLRYGAAYYPWLRTVYKPEIHFRDLAFKEPLAPLPADPVIDPLIINNMADTDSNALVIALRAADADVDSVVSAVNVSGWVSSPVTLDRRNFSQMLTHYDTLIESLRELPEPLVVTDVIQNLANLVLLPRALALGLQTVFSTAGLAAEITQTVTTLSTDSNVIAAILALVALEKHVDVMPLVDAGRDIAAVNSDYAVLNSTPWILPETDVANIIPNVDVLSGADERITALNAASAIQPHFEVLASAMLSIFDAADFLAAGAETRLFNGHEVMKAVREQVQATMALLPPSGAMAGIYSTVDRTRGVWKAPANVSIADAIGPTVKINDQSQGNLNVHTTGKSVNAIRAFTGQGTLVWGARTLAGNDNEWRYINVRRFYNMVEESVKKASEPFTFEPNDANTWVRIKAMIQNFLTIQWRQGALMGATAQKAYYVKVGLGETMTAEDILEGKMIIEIGMAAVRPAEFIILKFAHKMQVS